MLRIFAFFLVIQGVLMSATLEYHELKGVRVPVIYEVDKNLPIVSMQIVFENSGSIQDGNLSGLASLSASILNEGSKALGSAKFSEAMESKALGFFASSGKETFAINLQGLKEHFNYGVGLVAELLRAPNLEQKSLDKVKSVRLGGLAKKESDFDYVASINLNALVFEDTPLASPKLGTKESIEAISLDDIKRFLSAQLHLSNAIFVMGGDIDKALVNATLNKLLGNLEVGKKEPVGFYQSTQTPKNKEVQKETEQAYIYFASDFKLKADDPELYKAKVASFIFGQSGFGSRLMEEIRVKQGLAYSAYAYLTFNKTHSAFQGYLQTKLDNQAKSIKSVQSLLDEFVTNGATLEELQSAKKFILGSEPLRMETLERRIARSFNEFYKGQALGSYQKELKDIEALSLEELNRFIKAHQEIRKLSFSIVTK